MSIVDSISETEVWFRPARGTIGTYYPLPSGTLTIVYEGVPDLPDIDATDDTSEGDLPIPVDWEQALLDYVAWRMLQRVAIRDRNLWLPFQQQYEMFKRRAANNNQQGTGFRDVPRTLQF